MKKAIFFDRDGVVNVNSEYVYKISDFVYIDGFVEFFRFVKECGFLAFVITNQSGINRGFYNERDFKILSDFMQNDLIKKTEFCFDKIYHCPHLPSENCICRKPQIGMIQNAMQDFPIDLGQSFLIGDNESDIECAINAGIKTHILLSSTKKSSKATYIIDNFQKAHSIIV